MTYTYAVLDVSQATFDEVARRLWAADYHWCFDRDIIDMHGIALRADPPHDIKEITMPRKKDLDARQILAYFKTAPMDNARLILDLAKGEVAAREPKKQAPAAKPATPAPAAQTTAGQPTGPRRAPRTTTAQAPPAGGAPATPAAPVAAPQTASAPGGMAQV